MKTSFKSLGSAVVAISVGLVVLLGYFLRTDQPGFLAGFAVVREYFLQIAVLLVAVAALVGVSNLSGVHLKKLRSMRAGSMYSLLLLISLAGTFILGSYDYFVGVLGNPTQSWLALVFDYVQVPIEASLMAVLAIALAYASARMLRWRTNLISILFVLTVLVMLLGYGMDLPIVSDMIRPWITNVWAVGGARGLLLGVALGAIATGIRVLSGADRPYGG